MLKLIFNPIVPFALGIYLKRLLRIIVNIFKFIINVLTAALMQEHIAYVKLVNFLNGIAMNKQCQVNLSKFFDTSSRVPMDLHRLPSLKTTILVVMYLLPSG